jgi:hypothetical protein
VKNYQHSPMCCVLCSLTHPTLAHLSVSLASSTSTFDDDQKSTYADYMQLSMQLGIGDGGYIFANIMKSDKKVLFFSS